MLIRKLRLKRGWSQSQLADMAGVTTRTIQRLERGHKPSLETCKALASVFEVDFSLFHSQESDNMNDINHVNAAESQDNTINAEEQAALMYAQRVKGFFQLAATGLLFAVIFFFVFGPRPQLFLVFGVLAVVTVVQGLIAFEVINVFRPDWEKKLAEKKLGRKL